MKSSFCTCLVALSICTIFCGCIRTEESGVQVAGFTENNKEFAKISNSDLSLVMVGEHEKIAAPDQSVRFKLINNGTKSITIEEWHLNDIENFTVDCQAWLPGTREPDPDSWIPLIDAPEKFSRHYPLTLDPGNMVLVDIPLEFLSSLVISPNGERRYFIKATLSLQSVTVTSPVEVFTVRAK